MKTMYAKTPTVYQMEATECGAASLSMILGYYGIYLPLEKLRVETGVSRDGSNAFNILQAAENLGFTAKGFRKTLDALLKVKPPCIIHWNFNHFVVFEGQKGKYYYINDPAVGRRKLTLQELDSAFTGIVLTFEKTKAVKKEKNKRTLMAFVKQRLESEQAGIRAIISIGFLLIFPGVLIPAFSQIFVDEILTGGRSEWITLFLCTMGAALIFKTFMAYYQGLLLNKLKNKMSLLSAYRFMTHMFRLPMGFFDQRYAGDLAERVHNNDTVNDFLAGDLAEAVLNMLVARFYFILLFIYSPLLTVVAVVGMAVNFLFIQLMSSRLSGYTMKMQQNQGALSGSVYAGLNITSTLKASGAEDTYVSRILGYYAKTINMEQKIGRKQQILNVIPETLTNLSSILVLLFGGLQIMSGKLSAGMLVAFIALLSAFINPVNRLVGFARRIQVLKADMSRVDDVMCHEEDEKFKKEEEEQQQFTSKLKGNVELKNISFGYSRLEVPLIENFSFSLKSGSSIAFVGASGSGKSTLSKVISGLYMPWDGDILMDGISVRNIPKEIINSSVSTVSQKITLFSGTIRENLTLWNRSIMEEDMVQAAKDACIHDMITEKPGAYEYRLDENGANLSGGQRQRLEIACALATNPTVLIMDEATSALDPLVEKQILDNIKRRGCTCIIVAHRLSAIRDCDEIIVMQNGKIAERGTHEQLLDLNGHYKQLISSM